ncbi:hypothetical protein [Terriglobus sp. TAA 43]|uniref:hypothetical protein n=1 Tax=Terriglobus sp. TAA 43 TaxID=278961 RepID=UPI000645AC4F|nr:hypothetical protein [Terriglobus sp. TAA 43]
MAFAAKEEQQAGEVFGDLEKDPRWQLIQRIVETPGFVRSPRLSSFLLYISRQSLSGHTAGLNEQTIGEAVFERPIGYDSRDDNIVRSHASRLRTRLDTYFHEEGNAEPLRVSVPRGSYVPVFERVSMDSPALLVESIAVHTSGTAAPSVERRAKWQRTVWIGAAVVVVVGCLLVGWDRGIFTPEIRTPSHKLWTQMFRKDQDTLIVPADISLVMARLMSGRTVDLAEYASGRYKAGTICTEPCNRQLLQEIESRRYTSMADLVFVSTVYRHAEAVPNRAEIRYVRDLQLDDLKQSNVILSGSLLADPWLTLVEHEMNFVLHDNPANGALRVENRAPRQNERKEYFFNNDDQQHRGLATISFLPNLSGNGNLLIVQGFTLAGTAAAGEFVTGENDFDTLFQRYADNTAPLPHFEILLETMDVNGMGSRPRVLAWRTYP